MGDETNPIADAVSTEGEQLPSEGPKTLGVLFIHGIGTQRRGDTLGQAGSALHGCLRQWLTQPISELSSMEVELLDTSLAQPHADEPAHTRLILRESKLPGTGDPARRPPILLRKELEVSERGFLLAESCWAETFRPPSYSEFARWALRGFSLTVVLHMLSTFRRNRRIGQITTKALRQKLLTPGERGQLEADLGLDQGVVPSEARALRNFLRDYGSRAWNRWLISPFVLAVLLLVATCVQFLLLALVIIRLLPMAFAKESAQWVQRTVTAVMGDSYLFVTSPIDASAAVTQVKKDFEWLAERCDRVVLVAHSQGAAVVHRAIEEWSWEARVPEKLRLLVTYGSGLEKLYALKALLSGDLSPRQAAIGRVAGLCAVLGSMFVLTSCLWIVTSMAWWVALLSIAAGFVLLMLAFEFFASAFADAVPPPLEKVGWVNFFSSSDPVCNGPTQVGLPRAIETRLPVIDEMSMRPFEAMQAIRSQQREVVNLDSIVADHTSYWSSTDDFVIRVAAALLSVAEIPSPGKVDPEWIGHGVLRRRWRVGFRARSRHAAMLAALCIPAWPSDVIETMGRSVAGLVSRLLVSPPKWTVPHWTLGAGVLVLSIVTLYVVALAGWNAWERREVGQFLRREQFNAPRVALCVFALGWLGAIAVIPVATVLVFGEGALTPALWMLLALLTISGWAIARSGNPPNLFTTFIPWLVKQGELLVEQKAGNRSANFARACRYFEWSIHVLRKRGRDTEYLVRALLGSARVFEEVELPTGKSAEYQVDFYEQAIASLERMGRDAGQVRKRLEELISGGSAATTQDRRD